MSMLEDDNKEMNVVWSAVSRHGEHRITEAHMQLVSVEACSDVHMAWACVRAEVSFGQRQAFKLKSIFIVFN
jgi:hypothetical protein